MQLAVQVFVVFEVLDRFHEFVVVPGLGEGRVAPLFLQGLECRGLGRSLRGEPRR